MGFSRLTLAAGATSPFDVAFGVASAYATTAETVGGVTSEPYRLPTGATLVDACCLADCCAIK